MISSDKILDFHDPNMKDWKDQILLRDKAIVELFLIADAYHSMIESTRRPGEPYHKHGYLEKYRSFVEEIEEKNATK